MGHHGNEGGAARGACPNCGRCLYLEGQCVERISRGRRFFLMGALALPAAVKIEGLAPIVEAPINGNTYVYEGRNVWGIAIYSRQILLAT